MEEIWVAIEDFDNKYQVSNLGNIKSFHTGTGSKGLGTILKPNLNTYGYKKLDLTKDKKSKTYCVHQLVIRAFKSDTYFEGAQVNHINGVKTDNNVDNLEWVTQKENINHAYETGLMVPQIGYKKRKLNYEKAEEIRYQYSNKEYSLRELAAKYNVSDTCIYDVVHNKSWNYKG